jgi:uncharacterized membrane protein
MTNSVRWIVAGQILAVVMIIGLLAGPSVLKANSNQGDNSLADSAPAGLADAYRQSLTGPLNRAVGEVKEPEIAAFSQKLVQAYALDNARAESNMNDASGMASLLPDVAKIHRTAMDMPLKEAGKQIKDKELSDFYQSFISSIGVK